MHWLLLLLLLLDCMESNSSWSSRVLPLTSSLLLRSRILSLTKDLLPQGLEHYNQDNDTWLSIETLFLCVSGQQSSESASTSQRRLLLVFLRGLRYGTRAFTAMKKSVFLCQQKDRRERVSTRKSANGEGIKQREKKNLARFGMLFSHVQPHSTRCFGTTSYYWVSPVSFHTYEPLSLLSTRLARRLMGK
eukprot:gb/GECG01001908.1/.p1 GENE.gb/GECG01001908.1/~~gb/GECG01001908.1/.p1  ORF type:complete len:190 (+),score=7.96 gb/GECG01001908.1/:1-570(+)